MSFTINDFIRAEGLHPDLNVQDIQEYYGASLNDYETSAEAFESTMLQFEHDGLTEDLLEEYIEDMGDFPPLGGVA